LQEGYGTICHQFLFSLFLTMNGCVQLKATCLAIQEIAKMEKKRSDIAG
jgi:hypothetical protein